MLRSITVTPWYQQVFVPNQVDCYRLRLVASNNQGMALEVFRYLQTPAAPGESNGGGVYDGVCSPLDLVQYPADAPDPANPNLYFRLSSVDLLFASQALALAFMQSVHANLTALVKSLAYADNLIAGTQIGRASCR